MQTGPDDDLADREALDRAITDNRVVVAAAEEVACLDKVAAAAEVVKAEGKSQPILNFWI